MAKKTIYLDGHYDYPVSHKSRSPRKVVRTTDIFRVYTDGACEPNPGIGGYASVIFRGDDVAPRVIIKGGEKETTNNRMEIMGVLSTLRYLKNPSIVTFFSDSQYVVNSINQWLDGWIRGRKVKKNMDLWNEIYALKKKHTVRATWIKGHNGNFYNEFADGLSFEAIGIVSKGKKDCFEKIKTITHPKQ